MDFPQGRDDKGNFREGIEGVVAVFLSRHSFGACAEVHDCFTRVGSKTKNTMLPMLSQ